MSFENAFQEEFQRELDAIEERKNRSLTVEQAIEKFPIGSIVNVEGVTGYKKIATIIGYRGNEDLQKSWVYVDFQVQYFDGKISGVSFDDLELA